MKKTTATLSDDDMDKLLLGFHLHIRKQCQIAENSAMRQAILRMAEENIKYNEDKRKQPQASFPTNKLSTINTLQVHRVLKHQVQKLQVREKTRRLGILKSWQGAKVASWMLVASGVALFAAFDFNEHTTTRSITADDNSKPLPSAVTDSPSDLSTSQPLPMAANVNETTATHSTEEVITLEDVLGGDIVIAQIEPSIPKGHDNHLNNVPKTEGYQQAGHEPSIKITIEQAPVLPAGSVADPEQIAIENSI